MARDWYYVSGDWNVNCDVCSKKLKASDSKLRWDGFITCPDCWEQRHPMDFIRARVDKITVPFQRPIPTLMFTDVTYVDTGNTTIPSGNNNGEL